MKLIIVLGLLGACAAIPPHATGPGTGAVVVPTPPPLPTLTQDFEQLYMQVPLVPIRQLMLRYLLNDASFQAFIRIINSQDAFVAYMRLNSQPEMIGFRAWTNAQMMMSGGPLEIEAEDMLTFFNTIPYWSNTVYGWQGFVNEFLAYYPQAAIKTHIQMKLMQNGIFAQFYNRLKALKPVYERFLTFPETQRVIAALQLNGIDTVQLDSFIRAQFEWLPAPVAPTTTVAPVSASTLSTAATSVASAQPVPAV